MSEPCSEATYAKAWRVSINDGLAAEALERIGNGPADLHSPPGIPGPSNYKRVTINGRRRIVREAA